VKLRLPCLVVGFCSLTLAIEAQNLGSTKPISPFPGSLTVVETAFAGQQSPAKNLAGQGSASSGSSSLRICLRLQDETPFSGPASVRVMPVEGYEIAGRSKLKARCFSRTCLPGRTPSK
jgi:hypothetical protein